MKNRKYAACEMTSAREPVQRGLRRSFLLRDSQSETISPIEKRTWQHVNQSFRAHHRTRRQMQVIGMHLPERVGQRVATTEQGERSSRHHRCLLVKAQEDERGFNRRRTDVASRQLGKERGISPLLIAVLLRNPESYSR